MTDAERRMLPPKPLAFLRDAERRARTAVSLFDVGIARGLLLGLLKEGAITTSQYDAMFKRIYSKMTPKLQAIVDGIPKSRLAAGVVVPAAPRTRRARRKA
jgi:hypothetical protein